MKSSSLENGLPPVWEMEAELVAECKYGENASQVPAGRYRLPNEDPFATERFELVAGDAPSYNGLGDLNNLIQIFTHIQAALEVNECLPRQIPIGVKHYNPCGLMTTASASKSTAIQKMLDGDRIAIHGGTLLFNFPIGVDEANTLLTYGMKEGERRIIDGVIAPEFTNEAIETLRRKKDKCRFLQNPALAKFWGLRGIDRSPLVKTIRGGLLVQPNFTFVPDFYNNPGLEVYGDLDGLTIPNFLFDLIVAWAAGCMSVSNTITIVKDGMLVGNGCGQTDRWMAAEVALLHAKRSGHDTRGSVAYSDSFFPFPDGVEMLINAGVKVIFATKGGIRYKEIVKLCEDRGVVFITIPDALARGFRH